MLSKASAEAISAPDTDAVLDTLEHPRGSERRFGEDLQQAAAKCNAVLLDSLKDTWTDMVRR